jgi:hypothetical protein
MEYKTFGPVLAGYWPDRVGAELGDRLGECGTGSNVDQHSGLTQRRIEVLGVALACIIGGFAAEARALDRPRALVIAARSGAEHAAVEREVRLALADLGRVELLSPPAVDLEAAQLALDCTEASADCFGAVARRMDARVLVMVAVERRSGRVKLRLSYFDVGHGAEPRSAVAERKGNEVGRALLDTIPDLLRELFEGIEEPVEPELDAPAEEPGPEPLAPVAPAAMDRDGGGVPLGPVLLGVGGVGVIAAGIAVGAAMSTTQDRYAMRVIDSRAAADAAEADRELGRQQAVTANVLLGVGAAAVIAAGVWYALVSRKGAGDGEPRAHLVPNVSPDGAGVALFGAWEAVP